MTETSERLATETPPAPETGVQVTTIHGHPVYVDARGYFRAPTVSDHAFETLAALREHLVDVAKRQAKRRSLALRVLDHDGVPGTVTGLNLATGKETGIATLFRGRGAEAYGDLYPDTPYVRAALTRWRTLQHEADEVLKALRPVAGRFSRRVRSVDAYASALDAAEETYATMTAAAAELERTNAVGLTPAEWSGAEEVRNG